MAGLITPRLTDSPPPALDLGSPPLLRARDNRSRARGPRLFPPRATADSLRNPQEGCVFRAQPQRLGPPGTGQTQCRRHLEQGLGVIIVVRAGSSLTSITASRGRVLVGKPRGLQQRRPRADGGQADVFARGHGCHHRNEKHAGLCPAAFLPLGADGQRGTTEILLPLSSSHAIACVISRAGRQRGCALRLSLEVSGCRDLR